MRGNPIIQETFIHGALTPAPWVGALRYAGKVVSEAVFPPCCRACGAHWSVAGRAETDARRGESEMALIDVFREIARPYLCPACIGAFEPLASPLCTRCGKVFASRVGEDHLCTRCIRQPAAYRRARSAGVYSGGLMALIQHLKYRACLALKEPLAGLLQEVFRRHWAADEVDMVLPIPLHIRRWRERGFNQAQMLADAWATSGGRADRDRGRFPRGRQILVRSKPTRPQTGLGKQARRRNIRGAFSVIEPQAVKGARLLLVDDVYTTGATADEAARVLKRAGAACVDVLTVARTMPRNGSRSPLTPIVSGSSYD